MPHNQPEPSEEPSFAGTWRRAPEFIVVMTAASIVGLAKGFVFAKLLGATDFGYYGLVVLVAQFGTYLAGWGIANAVFIQLPQSYGRVDDDTYALIERGLSAMILSTALTASVYLAVVVTVPSLHGETQTALILASFLTVGLSIGEFLLLLLRVRQRLRPVALIQLGRACLALSVGALAGILGGYQAIIVGELAAIALAGFTAWRVHGGLRVRRPSSAGVRRLVRFGAPLMVASLLNAAIFTIDRFFVAAALPRELGQYVFASLVVTMWLAIISIAGVLVYPQLLHAYGAGMPLRAVRDRVLRLTAVAGAVGAVGLAIVLVGAPILSEGIFSEYAAGLKVMPILYLGGLIGMLALPQVLLQSLRPPAVALAAVVAVIVSVTGGFLLSAGHPALTDFAWLFVAAQAVMTVLTVVLTVIEVRRAAEPGPAAATAPRH